MNGMLIRLWTALMVWSWSASAWAASSGAAPGGDQGGSGSEPETIALIAFSLLPGFFFARKAMAARTIEAGDR